MSDQQREEIAKMSVGQLVKELLKSPDKAPFSPEAQAEERSDQERPQPSPPDDS
jgi:hypothetical protein